MAIAALVMTFVCFPIGLILGILALVQINNAGGEIGGKGVALAAVIMSGLSVPFVAMLTAIAVPNFVRYQLRSKTAEARTNLRAIAAAQESSHRVYGRYLKAEASAPTPGPALTAWAAQPCDPACAYDQPAQCTSFDCIEFAPDRPMYFSYACEATEDGGHYTCAALGDLDDDGVNSLFVFGNGEADIVAPIPSFGGRAPQCRVQPTAGLVVDCTPGVF